MRILGIFCLLLIAPTLVLAQGFSGAGVDTSSSLNLDPALPQPNSTFTATIHDYSGGGYGSEIRWFYNGAPIQRGNDSRSITLQAGEAGSTNTLEAVLGGADSTKTLSATIKPLYLDIILEPQTHVPVFYKGRALPSVGSTVLATALLSNPSMLTGNYFYTWKLNNTVIGKGPLYNQNEISFTMPQDSESTLSVTVTDTLGTPLARRTIAIPSVSPKLVFYEVNTLYGLIERAITNQYTLISNSATLRAEPYYLSSSIFNNPSIAEWNLAGQTFTRQQNPYEIDLERSGTAGTVDLEFRVQSTTELLQGAKARININT